MTKKLGIEFFDILYEIKKEESLLFWKQWNIFLP